MDQNFDNIPENQETQPVPDTADENQQKERISSIQTLIQARDRHTRETTIMIQAQDRHTSSNSRISSSISRTSSLDMIRGWIRLL